MRKIRISFSIIQHYTRTNTHFYLTIIQQSMGKVRIFSQLYNSLSEKIRICYLNYTTVYGESTYFVSQLYNIRSDKIRISYLNYTTIYVEVRIFSLNYTTVHGESTYFLSIIQQPIGKNTYFLSQLYNSRLAKYVFSLSIIQQSIRKNTYVYHNYTTVYG